MSELAGNLLLGLGAAATPANLLYSAFGVLLGTLVGVLPGIGAITTIAMVLPLTFGLDPLGALIMLAGIYYGAVFGSSTTSILLNMPGTAAAAVVCLDGYQMARQGRAGQALMIAAICSFFGGTLGVFLIVLAGPALAGFALSFGAAEYFSLMLLGLLAATLMSTGAMLKGLAMVVLGLLLGLVGTDVATGMRRYTFGVVELADGLNFVVLAMGLFGFAEILSNLNARGAYRPLTDRLPWRALIPRLADLKTSAGAMLRGGAIGSALGALPGAGPTVSAFMAYAVEKRVARDPSRFGQGAVEGVAAPEAANNAAAQTGFIPTLTLGIPGDAVAALMLGALLIQGIVPGPQVMETHPSLFWGLIVSMWIGNLLLLVLNLPLVGIWVRVLAIPYRLLFPAMVAFLAIGVFSLANSTLHVVFLAVFGLFGYLLQRLACPPAPLLLGFILGPMMEENLRRAMQLSRGDSMVFLERPISLALILAAAAVLLLILWGELAGTCRRDRFSA
ncbi:MAG: tripartite tricarboxylate transporter permease [Kiloniellales bacterium]|nr:tripartite tricarboxylate transporter permease [Kiloniellales bacterium]